MANDQARDGQPKTDEQLKTPDATISGNARPATDDSVVEGIDEANPGVTGSPRPDAVPAKSGNTDKAA